MPIRRRRLPTAGTTDLSTVDPVTGFSLLDSLLDKAVQVPSAVIHEHVMRLRRRNPHASPGQVLALLDREFLLAVSTSGAAVGAAATPPAVGTGVSVALTTSEVATFFAASSAYSLAVASVYGIEIDETARRRTLLLATVLGDQGVRTINLQTGLNAQAWGRTLLVNMPTSTVTQVNRILAKRMLRTQATRQGALAIGRLTPFGIGMVIGVAGARVLGRRVVTSARRAFGEPPQAFPETLNLEASATPPAELPGAGPTPLLPADER